MEQMSPQGIVLLLAALAVVGGWFWTQMRPAHRVRRSMQRSDARARSLHRH